MILVDSTGWIEYLGRTSRSSSDESVDEHQHTVPLVPRGVDLESPFYGCSGESFICGEIVGFGGVC
jgi:hypothetical protein